MIRRPPRSTQGVSSAASDVYKRQVSTQSTWVQLDTKKGWNHDCFGSIAYNKGLTTSRRDDLESLGYNLINFAIGALPWSKTKGTSKLVKRKEGCDLKVLCEGLPEEFEIFMKYAKTLSFEAKPDYSYLKSLFEGLIIKQKLKYDCLFDWCDRSELSHKMIQGKPETELCKICLSNVRSTLLYPCRHFGLCQYCAPMLKDCPFCQAPIEKSEIIYPQQ
eukprot:TRINITY_DN15966_c0_g1_i1.p1 TRINITY_DN15966_c0_g1~~TRINITY_DN15966_c0_g1_i1.p1  ORF type:complete len:218 (-),score=26.66 TRINITY_DN15966_c0_g1_i1:8-661(-)